MKYRNVLSGALAIGAHGRREPGRGRDGRDATQAVRLAQRRRLVVPHGLRVSRMRLRFLAPLASIVLLAGCASSHQSKSLASPATDAAATATHAAPPSLVGTYERTVTKADIKRTAEIRHEGPRQAPPSPGPAHLVITKTTVTFIDPAAQPPFSIEQDVTATPGGHLAINGYVHPDKGSFCGPEVPQNASYNWTRAGNVLRVKAVTDRCADRDSILTGIWRRTA
jgi:hypothetical protein